MLILTIGDCPRGYDTHAPEVPRSGRGRSHAVSNEQKLN